MNVQQLIEELSKMPPELEVYTEGCDCDGDVGAVVLVKDYGPARVYLERSTES